MKRFGLGLLGVCLLVGTPAWASGIVGTGLAFGAKEMCSCLFVMEQSLKDCKRYVDTGVPIPFRYQTHEDRVTVRLFGVFKREAVYTGPKTGCRLK